MTLAVVTRLCGVAYQAALELRYLDALALARDALAAAHQTRRSRRGELRPPRPRLPGGASRPVRRRHRAAARIARARTARRRRRANRIDVAQPRRGPRVRRARRRGGRSRRAWPRRPRTPRAASHLRRPDHRSAGARPRRPRAVGRGRVVSARRSSPATSIRTSPCRSSSAALHLLVRQGRFADAEALLAELGSDLRCVRLHGRGVRGLGSRARHLAARLAAGPDGIRREPTRSPRQPTRSSSSCGSRRWRCGSKPMSTSGCARVPNRASIGREAHARRRRSYPRRRRSLSRADRARRRHRLAAVPPNARARLVAERSRLDDPPTVGCRGRRSPAASGPDTVPRCLRTLAPGRGAARRRSRGPGRPPPPNCSATPSPAVHELGARADVAVAMSDAGPVVPAYPLTRRARTVTATSRWRSWLLAASHPAARGAATARRGSLQPGDRRGPVHQRQDGQRARRRTSSRSSTWRRVCRPPSPPTAVAQPSSTSRRRRLCVDDRASLSTESRRRMVACRRAIRHRPMLAAASLRIVDAVRRRPSDCTARTDPMSCARTPDHLPTERFGVADSSRALTRWTASSPCSISTAQADVGVDKLAAGMRWR